MEWRAAKELAGALDALEFSLPHQDVAALHHDLRQALYRHALVATVVHVHVVGLRRERPLHPWVEDHDIGVATSSTKRLRVIRPEFTPPWKMSEKRSSTPGKPLGIFEKSPLPRSFWPLKWKGQWSVATSWRSSCSRPFQSSSWCDAGRSGGEQTYLAPSKPGRPRSSRLR